MNRRNMMWCIAWDDALCKDEVGWNKGYLVSAVLVAELGSLDVIETEGAGGRGNAAGTRTPTEDDHVGREDRFDGSFSRHCKTK